VEGKYVGLLDSTMQVWAVPYRATRTKILCGRKSLESGRIRQIVYKYRASPTVRSIDFIIPMHHFQRFIPPFDKIKVVAAREM
jgi:hypothetical protein